MSENKRKAARTQGRFSNEKEFRPKRQDKEKQSSQKGSRNQRGSPEQDESIKNPSSKPAATAEGITIQYQDNCTHTFPELIEARNEEIRDPGVHILSKTENGISRIIYEPEFMGHPEVAELMDGMEKSVPWSDKNIIIRGKEMPQPRQVAWYGPLPYSYAGAVFDAAEMPEYILKIKAQIEEFLRQYISDVHLNSVLLNLYRNGNDSVAWHSDDELTMGVSPTIASLSLGAVRAFEMRPKSHVKSVNPSTIYRVHLQPGSLLIMDGCMQQDWKHQVPKEPSITKPRINLTFRTVYAVTKIPAKVPDLETRTSTSNQNITHPEHTYDPNSFPSLPGNSQPREKSSISGISETNQESIVQNKPGNISADFEAMDKKRIDDIENNLNKNVIHSENIDILKCDETMNLNLTESEEASEEATHLTNAPSDYKHVSGVENEKMESFEETREHEHSLEKEVNRQGEALNCPQYSKVFVDNEQNRKSHEINKHQLNANAPDFIPKGIVDKMSCPKVSDNFNGRPLKELADVYLQNRVRPEEMKEFTTALIESVKDKKVAKDLFSTRDWFELDVLCELSQNGQNEKNQKVINNRICSLTKHASKFEEKLPRYHQKSSYSGSKNLYYKSSPHRY